MEYKISSPLAALVSSYAVSFLLQYIDIALLSQWSFLTGGPTSGLLDRLSLHKFSLVWMRTNCKKTVS